MFYPIGPGGAAVAPRQNRRFALAINVIQIGKTAWAWELRNADGSLFTDSAKVGEYAVFADPIKAFDDASENARVHFTGWMEG